MRAWKNCGAFVFLVSTLLLAGCSDNADNIPEQSASPTEQSATESFHGWNALALNNGYVKLNIVPELGGKIMGYALFGDELLWHNPVHIGETAIFAQNDLGGEFINAGGAKVWPSPQNKWGGPPDSVIDGHPYEADYDGTTVTLLSPADTGEGRTGLQYEHRYSLTPRTTFVNLSLSMTNRATEPVEWSLWHLATVPASIPGTVYVPVASDDDWNVMYGDPESSQWQGVEDGLFRARFNGMTGKVGLTVTDGWAVWHDESRDIAFALLFETEDGAAYPNGGNHVEIYSTGTVTGENGSDNPDLAHLEVEVLSPLTDLAPGDAATLDLRWAACRCSAIKKVSQHGIVAERLAYDGEFITGKLGTFISGVLMEFMYDAEGNQVAMQRLSQVSPNTEIELRRDPVIPPSAVGIRYQVVDARDTVLGVLEDVRLR